MWMAPPRVGHLFHEGVHRFGVGGVDAPEDQPVLVEVDRLLERGGFFGEEVGDGELEIPVSESLDEGRSEPSCTPGDHCHLVGQVSSCVRPTERLTC